MGVVGLKVVVTHHGPDYRRAKWGNFAKLILKAGEWAGITFANGVITIADNIAKDLKKKYRRNNITVIPNGVIIPEPVNTGSTLKKYSLQKNKYILSVGRFVPEKGFHDLIDAFNRTQNNNFKLVIVGDADHEDSYSLALKEKGRKNSDVVLTGFLTGKPLQELYSNAALFVLPSYHEGLPIALLEAMSYGLSCLASSIPANQNVELSEDRFFRVGNIETLHNKLKEYAGRQFSEKEKSEQIKRIAENYNWVTIAHKTLAVYNKVLES